MTVSADAIIAVIAAEASLDPAQLTPEATLQELDIGSLDLASAVFELEDRFGVVIDSDAISPASSVADLVAYVQSLASSPAAR